MIVLIPGWAQKQKISIEGSGKENFGNINCTICFNCEKKKKT